jgi:hypothetical protein
MRRASARPVTELLLFGASNMYVIANNIFTNDAVLAFNLEGLYCLLLGGGFAGGVPAAGAGGGIAPPPCCAFACSRKAKQSGEIFS